MFDQLVESSAVKRRSNRWLYFTVTAAIWVSVLTAVIVWGIMAYDAKLNEQFNLPEPVDLIAETRWLVRQLEIFSGNE